MKVERIHTFDSTAYPPPSAEKIEKEQRKTLTSRAISFEHERQPQEERDHREPPSEKHDSAPEEKTAGHSDDLNHLNLVA